VGKKMSPVPLKPSRKQYVLKRHPDACYTTNPMTGQHVIFKDETRSGYVLGTSWINARDAWANAAERIKKAKND
jgi:hypothetical protein